MVAKLPRAFQQLFGLNGSVSHFGEFGSRALGVPVNTKDPSSIQALAAFINNGWLDAINGANKAPFLEDMNALHFLIFYQLCYGFQSGVPEWDTNTTYFTGSIVRAPGTSLLYGSAIDNNQGNALPNQVSNGQWNFLNPASVAPGIMAEFGGVAAPFGWLLCDGTVYAQAAFPNLFAAIGSTWNIGGEGAGNFRVPDFRGRVTMGAGQGAGLTNRVLATLLGEETHLLVNSEVPTLIDPGHGHNIRGVALNSNDNSVCLNGAGANGIDAGSTHPGSDTYLTVNANGVRWIATAGTGISYGGGGSHNIIQPSAVVTKIIKI